MGRLTRCSLQHGLVPTSLHWCSNLTRQWSRCYWLPSCTNLCIISKDPSCIYINNVALLFIETIATYSKLKNFPQRVLLVVIASFSIDVELYISGSNKSNEDASAHLSIYNSS